VNEETTRIDRRIDRKGSTRVGNIINKGTEERIEKIQVGK